jgi:AraC-like DNA-binding protein
VTKRQKRAAGLRETTRATTRRQYDAIFTNYVRDCGARRTSGRIEELCRFLGRSRTSFSRIIRDLFGKSPVEILRERRLEEAKRLLRVTDSPIDEVAAASAFGHRSTLHRVFTKAFGMSPSEYREQASRR